MEQEIVNLESIPSSYWLACDRSQKNDVDCIGADGRTIEYIPEAAFELEISNYEQ